MFVRTAPKVFVLWRFVAIEELQLSIGIDDFSKLNRFSRYFTGIFTYFQCDNIRRTYILRLNHLCIDFIRSYNNNNISDKRKGHSFSPQRKVEPEALFENLNHFLTELIQKDDLAMIETEQECVAKISNKDVWVKFYEFNARILGFENTSYFSQLVKLLQKMDGDKVRNELSEDWRKYS
eukprot:TRINITY_DN1413_c0_g1_i9.p1 TRINITY_DN1413_c0_g1~~TRINITY_DN1413_c0_g1_i9.p1  ORF type:complete len:179 (+),score=6.92 TRINITY_DN1413_c0_g1_i9:105-641(+)